MSEWIPELFTQMGRSSLVVLGILLIRQVLKKHLTAKWLYFLCVTGGIWLLLPTSPPSNFNLWSDLSKNVKSMDLAEASPPSLLPVSGNEKPSFDQSVFPNHKTYKVENVYPDNAEIVDVPSPKEFSLPHGLAAFWALGFLVLVSLCLVRQKTIWKAKRVNDPRLQILLNEAISILKIKCDKFVIRRLDANTSPAFSGVFRPTMFLPLDFESNLTDTEIRHVFLHELTHYKRGDLFTRSLLRFALLIHWFNPVAWWLFRVSNRDMEVATDTQVMDVLSGENDGGTYGATLLKIAKSLNQNKLPFTAHFLGMAEHSQSSLEDRIRQIMDYQNQKRRGNVVALTAAVLGICLLSCYLGFSPSHAQDKAVDDEAEKLFANLDRLNSIIVKEAEFDNVPFLEAVKKVEELSHKNDPKKKGVKIEVDDSCAPNVLESVINLKLNNVPLIELLRSVSNMANLFCDVRSDSIIIIPVEKIPVEKNAELFTKLFTVPPTFLSGGVGVDPFTESISKMPRRYTARNVLENAGITFPPGATAIYNPSTSGLIVRNTPDELALVEAYIESVNKLPFAVYITTNVLIANESFKERLLSNSPRVEGITEIDQFIDIKVIEQRKAAGVEDIEVWALVNGKKWSDLHTDLKSSNIIQASNLRYDLIRRSEKPRAIFCGKIKLGMIDFAEILKSQATKLDPVDRVIRDSIDLTMSCEWEGENAELMRPLRMHILIDDGSIVLLTGKIAENKHILVACKVEIVKPVEQRAAVWEKSTPAVHFLDKSLQDAIKKADVLALLGRKKMDDGDLKAAEESYRNALKVLPEHPITQSLQKIYMKQWLKALKAE